MNLIRQELRSHCLLASTAMVLDVTVDEIMKFLGHDGCALLDPNDEDSLAGFHIQEIIDYSLLVKDTAVTEVQGEFATLYGQDQIHVVHSNLPDRFLNHLTRCKRGVLLARTDKGQEHAMAFEAADAGSLPTVYDPRGKVGPFEEMTSEANHISGAFGLLRFDRLAT